METPSVNEAILGAATALNGQWSESWIGSLRAAVTHIKMLEASVIYYRQRFKYLRDIPMDAGLSKAWAEDSLADGLQVAIEAADESHQEKYPGYLCICGREYSITNNSD